MSEKRTTPRKEQAKITKQRIVDVATGLFGRRGYEAVTVDDICDEAGVSKGGFYHHFPSKDQILLEQFMKVDSFYRQLEQRIAREGSMEEKLYRISIETLKQISDFGIDLIKVAYSSQLRLNKGVSPLASSQRYIYKMIRSVLKEGQEKGEFREDIDATERTRTIISSYRGLIVEWCLKNGRFDLVEAGKDLVDNLLKGITTGN